MISRADALKRLAKCRELQKDQQTLMVAADIVNALTDSPNTGSLAALLQWTRGMCSDEAPHPEIDAKLAEAVERAKDLEEALTRIAGAESGHWGWIAREVLYGKRAA